MNTVERIKAICKERKIPISRLEKECGFANAYISQLRKGTMPDDKLQKVADFLELSVEYLIKGDEANNKYYFNDETAEIAQELFDRKDIRVLFDAARTLSPEDIKVVQNMVDALMRKN